MSKFSLNQSVIYVGPDKKFKGEAAKIVRQDTSRSLCDIQFYSIYNEAMKGFGIEQKQFLGRVHENDLIEYSESTPDPVVPVVLHASAKVQRIAAISTFAAIAAVGLASALSNRE
jgi:hypothetical protein